MGWGVPQAVVGRWAQGGAAAAAAIAQGDGAAAGAAPPAPAERSGGRRLRADGARRRGRYRVRNARAGGGVAHYAPCHLVWRK